jgi:hypothetical protein
MDVTEILARMLFERGTTIPQTILPRRFPKTPASLPFGCGRSPLYERVVVFERASVMVASRFIEL